MFSSSKVKNDEKAKRRPNQAVLFVSLALALLVLGIALVVILNTSGIEDNGLPTARLLYTSDYKQVSLNLQTGEKTIVDNNMRSNYGSAKYSPNGKWIAIWNKATESNLWELQLQNAETRGLPTTLDMFKGGGGYLSWSADSQWILFSAFPGDAAVETWKHNDQELWLFNIETRELKRLTENTFIDGGAAFSPDGTQIVYTSSADGYNRLYMMDFATGESRLLSPDTFGYGPVWSPDGQWIAFWTNHQGYDGDIWIIRADGTGAQAITTDRSDDSNPMWLP